MASKEKARQFLEASGSHAHYSAIVKYIIGYLLAKAEREGNTRFADDLRKAEAEHEAEFAEAIEVTEAVYCELFSDAELDDLIFLHANPALRKSRECAGTIVNKILEKFSEVRD